MSSSLVASTTVEVLSSILGTAAEARGGGSRRLAAFGAALVARLLLLLPQLPLPLLLFHDHCDESVLRSAARWQLDPARK